MIVKYHGGTEYDALPSAAQVALVRALTASPYVDLVAGEHAHVVQPITKVNGKWVVYGLGNMIAQNEVSRPRTYEGISVRFTFREGRHGWVVDRAAYVPTYWNHYSSGRPIRIQQVVRALQRGIGDRARLEGPAARSARPSTCSAMRPDWKSSDEACSRRCWPRPACSWSPRRPARAPAAAIVDQPGQDTSVAAETAVVTWDGTTETIALRLSTRSDAVHAGLIVPTPAAATVTLGDEQMFTDLAAVIAPRSGVAVGAVRAAAALGGGGDDGASGRAPRLGRRGAGHGGPGTAQRHLASSTNPAALEGWLRATRFRTTPQFTASIAPYVTDTWNFVAIQLDATAPSRATCRRSR